MTPDAVRGGLPFTLPERPAVTRIRRVDPLALRAPKGPRTQPMRGFEATYADIVDYIVRITEEIWVDPGDRGGSTTPTTTPARSTPSTASRDRWRR